MSCINGSVGNWRLMLSPVVVIYNNIRVGALSTDVGAVKEVFELV